MVARHIIGFQWDRRDYEKNNLETISQGWKKRSVNHNGIVALLGLYRIEEILYRNILLVDEDLALEEI